MINKIQQTVSAPKAIFLMGPTTSGKTKLAIELHKILPIELINVDSSLIYRGMNIGTAKPSIEELRISPHRLIDILDPAQKYSVANFRRDALIEMKKIVALKRIPLLVGGTMLYYKALLEGLSPLPSANLQIREEIKQQAYKKGWNFLYKKLEKIDPNAAIRIHPNDHQRISRALEVFFISGKILTELIQIPKQSLPYRVYQFALFPESRKLLYEKIEKRFYRMLNFGFEEEVRQLFSRGDLHENMPSIRCIGYRQMWSLFKGELSYDEMIYQSIYATRQLAKKQITWLRNWSRIHWLSDEQPKKAIKTILNITGIT